jgi:hypothetical protein
MNNPFEPSAFFRSHFANWAAITANSCHGFLLSLLAFKCVTMDAHRGYSLWFAKFFAWGVL